MKPWVAYACVTLLAAILVLAAYKVAQHQEPPAPQVKVVLRWPDTPAEFVQALSKLQVDRFADKTELAPGIRADCLYAKSEARGFMVGVCTFKPLLAG